MRQACSKQQGILSRLRRDQEGSAIVEFALIIPFLLLLTVGLIDIGRMMWYRTTLEHVAREGTRFAAVRGASSLFPASQAAVEEFVANRSVGIGGDDLGIDVTWAPSNAPGSTVTVAVTFDFSFFISGILPLDPFRMRSASTMIVS